MTILGALIEIVAQVLCISGLYGRKLKWNRHLFFLISAVLFLFYGINENGYPVILKFVAYVLIFLYCLIDFEPDVKKAVVNYCLSFICMFFIELCISIPLSLTLTMTEGVTVTMYIEQIMSLIVLCVAYLLARQPWLTKLSALFRKKIQFIVIIVIMVVYMMVLLLQMILAGVMPGKDIFVIAYIGLFLGIMLYEWQKANREIDKKENQLLMNRLYADAYEELILLVREKQHDVKNHINAMQSMIYTAGSYEELVEKQKAYCDYIVDESAMTSILTSIENPLIAGFMYHRIKDAQSRGIGVEYDLAFSKEPLQITEYSIVEMMGILFDNAVESVMALTQEQAKKFSVVLMRMEDKMVFTLSNPYGMKDSGQTVDITSLFSGSSKGKNRGIGIKKLKKMVKEADGCIYVAEHSDDAFSWVDISIELPLRAS